MESEDWGGLDRRQAGGEAVAGHALGRLQDAARLSSRLGNIFDGNKGLALSVRPLGPAVAAGGAAARRRPAAVARAPVEEVLAQDQRARYARRR